MSKYSAEFITANGVLIFICLLQESQDKLECASENLRADLDRWHDEKKADLKKLFLALANQQMKCYEQV